LESSAPYTLFGLTLGVGPREHDSEPAYYPGTVTLNVEFTYDRGYPARAPSLDDAGEEGSPEFFDFKHVIATHQVVAETADKAIQVVVTSGADIYNRLTFETLARIEAGLIEARRASRDEAKADEAVIKQFIDFGALQ
jgi:hypothetical protein